MAEKATEEPTAAEEPKTAPKKTAPAKPAEPKVKRYFVVNPAGGIQEVTYAHAVELLKRLGFRMATKGEIQGYLNAPAHKGFGPVAPRWEPNPDEAPEIEGFEE